jgi:hypothetical protein
MILMAMGSKAFENPLISNARMRAMYRAMVELSALAPSLGRNRRLPRGLEACWVGTAIGLEPSDLTSDERGTAPLQYIRDAGQRPRDSGPAVSSLRSLDDRSLPLAKSASERLLCAIGAAQALRTVGQSAVMTYLAGDDLKRSDWLRLLAMATLGDLSGTLPLVLVVTPGRSAATFDLGDVAAKAGKSLGRRLPVLPVDASDAVALYRAAQESLGRARTTGGAVVLECIRTGADPIRLLGEQLVSKKICTSAWCARVSRP